MDISFRRILSITVLFVLSFEIIFLPQTAFAKDIQPKTIKVGYYDVDSVQKGTSDEEGKHGYGYEYLQMISNYNGWKYEYIYGDWSVLMEMLLHGEIDLLMDVSYTPEREGEMLFPDFIMGTESYYMCVAPDNDTISAADVSTFNGARIGVNRGSVQQKCVEDWAEKNNLDIEIVPYWTDSLERTEHLKKGIIDASVELDRNIDLDVAPLFRIADSDYYLAVVKDRPDLLQELNDALTEIHDTMPYFINDLRHKYFQDTIVDIRLTEIEREYLSGRDKIRIGYLDNYLPYSDYNESIGAASGAIVDIFDNMQSKLDFQGVELEYIAYSSAEELESAFSKKEIDVFATQYSSLWLAEQGGYMVSSSYAEVPMDLIYQKGFDPQEIQKLAVSKENLISYYYAVSSYTDDNLLLYDSTDACIDAVLSEEADAAITNNFVAQYYMSGERDYRRLNYVELPDQAALSFGVAKEDAGLLSLLNRGISVTSSSAISSSLAKYAVMDHQYTIEDFLRDYFWYLVMAVLIVGMLVILLFVLQKHKNEKEKLQKLNEKNAVIQQQNELLETALEQAKEASYSKTRFLSNMSHDMRTPMNAIIGFAGLLTKRANDPEAVLECAEKISASSDRLLALIDDVLYMSDMEREEVKLELSECSLKEIIGELEAQIEADILAKKLHFTCHTDDIWNEYVLCDKARVKRVLLNILTNAVTYTKPDGSIFLTVKQYGESIQGFGAYEFRIRDTGMGMSREFLKNIFKPFERARTSTESGITGVGLGMPVCKNIVEMMKGTITVDSEEGVGTEVVIDLTFRCWTPEDAPQETAAEEEVTFEGKRLLLVEDNELNREIAYEILTDAGFIVEEAEDGDIAVEKVRQSDFGYFDAVLMDIQMPVMDGYTATREIRKIEKHRDIPIIALTANALDEDKRKALEAGMNAHVGKPIDLDRLFSALSDVLKENR